MSEKERILAQSQVNGIEWVNRSKKHKKAKSKR